MLFPRAPGEGGGLSFVSPLSFFQLASQPVIFFSQSFPFPLQSLPLLLPLLLLPSQLFNFLTQLFIRSPRSTPPLLKLCELAFQLA